MIMLIFLLLTTSSIMLYSVVMISFYILSKRLRLKRKGLSDARAASSTKKCDFAEIFSNDLQSL